MLIPLVFVCSAIAAAPADFDAFFKEFAEKRDGIRVLEARFTQENILPDEVLTTEGTLLYAQPRRIIYRTEDPPRTTLIDGARGYEYEPDIRQLVVYDLEATPQLDVFFLGFDSDPGALRENFDVSLFEVKDDPRGTKGIQLKPKANEDDAFFEHVDLYLRDADFLPYRIFIRNDVESQTMIEVRDFLINQPPEPARTQIELVEGTKVIINDQVTETVGPAGKRLPEPIAFSGAAAPPAAGATEVESPPPLVPSVQAAPAEERAP